MTPVPKEMRVGRSVCPRDCYDTCLVLARVDEFGEIFSVRGDPGSPFTQGFLCPRGNKDPDRMVTNRVLHPSVRSGPKPGASFGKVTWEKALDHVAERLDEVLRTQGPEKVLLLDYAGNMGLIASAFPHRLWNALAATRTDHGICTLSGHEGIALHYGLTYGIDPEDLPQKKVIVYWGFNAAVSSPHMWALSLKARKDSGARIIAVDPRKTETAARADLWIRPRPGTDVALAYGVAHCLIRDGLVDRDFISRCTSGFEDYGKEAAAWTPDRVQDATGVDETSIQRLAAAYGGSSPGVILIGIGMQKAAWGAEAVRAASLLPALLGEHRGFFYSNQRGFLVDTGYLAGRTLTERRGPVVSQVGLSDLVAQGRFRFIFVYGTNPCLTLPNQNAFRKGLAREDVFLVVHETHWSETTRFADVVLPAQTYLEKEDVVIPWSHLRTRKSNRVTSPLVEGCHEVELMTGISRRLGLKDQWLYEDPWEALRYALRDGIQEGTFEDLLSSETVKLKQRPRAEYQTRSGKIEFASSAARQAGHSPLPEHHPAVIGQDEYLLLSSSLSKYTHTQFQEVFGEIPPLVTINPLDAEKEGIRGADTVTIYNELGEIVLTATVSDSVPPGVMWSPKELTGLDGTPQNALTSATPQRIGGGSVFNSTLVRIRA